MRSGGVRPASGAGWASRSGSPRHEVAADSDGTRKSAILSQAGPGTPVALPAGVSGVRTRLTTSRLAQAEDAVAELRDGLAQPDMRAVLFFCSPSYDLARLGAALRGAFACPVVGCTSAGQIGTAGYERGGITAASLAGASVVARPYLVTPLSRCRERAAGVAAEVRARLDEGLAPGWRAFGLILVDGLALAEEALAATLYQSLGNVPMVGGSAADDLKFEHTAVYWDGAFVADAALFTLFETSLPFATLKVQHLRPTARKLVITSADPSRRLVKEINGLPAAEAYAELLGLEPDALDSAVFSRSPLLLRIGSDDYVRSIAQVNADRSMTFFCAIDEGLVLSVGEAVDPLSTLEHGLRQACEAIGEPSLVIGCDCILRRVELEQRRLDGQVGARLAAAHVIGFSTYGEQINGLHVNQTFTGVALGR